MAKDQDEIQRSETETASGESGQEPATPTPEPHFSVDVKKTRREAVEEKPEMARALPFKLNLDPVSSQEIPSIQVLAGLRDDWAIQPILLEEGKGELDKPLSPSDFELPHLKIWESAKLNPTTPLHKSVNSVEIRLPPRRPLSVKPLEGDRDDEKRNQMSEADSLSESASESDVESGKIEDTEGMSGDEVVPKGPGIDGIPPLYEFLFESVEGSIASREPICVVAAKSDDDKYRQTLETLCREQFRQHVGGKPHADLLASTEVETIEQTRVQNRIVSIDDSDSGFFEFTSRIDQDVTAELLEEESSGDLERLRMRIDEFFSEGLGYLLLFVEDRFAGDLYEHLRSAKEIRESNEIIQLRLRPLPDDVKREIVRLAWGNVHIDTDGRELDHLFHTAEDRFKDALKPRGEVEEITSHDENPESRMHYWVKCFVVEYLLNREGLKPISNYTRPDLKQKVMTEEQPWGDSNPRPDVYLPRSGGAFEIETLYESDHKKITRTIDKYEGTNVKQVNVIVPNLTCLRNLDAVLRKTQEKPGEMFQNDVKFWTLNLAERELMPLGDLCQDLNELYERSEHVM